MSSEVSAGFTGFSQAAENNKSVISAQLKARLKGRESVLEVGSGTGQHICHFARELPDCVWQPSDRGEYFDLLCSNLAARNLTNVRAPVYFGAGRDARIEPLTDKYDAVYCANVLHIMAQDLMADLIARIATALVEHGRLFLYGPFKYDGQFTTESNAKFDIWLKSRDPASGIRDIEILSATAQSCGLMFEVDEPMPANNQFLVFSKKSDGSG